jgi:hypothetical protein
LDVMTIFRCTVVALNVRKGRDIRPPFRHAPSIYVLRLHPGPAQMQWLIVSSRPWRKSNDPQRLGRVLIVPSKEVYRVIS